MCMDACVRKLIMRYFSSNTPTVNKAATTKVYVVAVCYYYPIDKTISFDYPRLPWLDHMEVDDQGIRLDQKVSRLDLCGILPLF